MFTARIHGFTANYMVTLVITRPTMVRIQGPSVLDGVLSSNRKLHVQLSEKHLLARREKKDRESLQIVSM